MRRKIGYRLLLWLLVGSLSAACGPAGVTQTNKTERFTVVMSIDGLTIAERVIDLTITDQRGTPVDADLVAITPVMREMGMTEPEATATRTGPGRYTWKGQPFTMLGTWQLNVRIVLAGSEDATTFVVEVS